MLNRIIPGKIFQNTTKRYIRTWGDNVPDLVSVVIPLYNKGPYIARTLDSVLCQTFQNFEVIVMDDGSTDNGAEVVRMFHDPRIRLIQQENHGLSATRNRGVGESRGAFIAFLDADDEWMPEHLEVLERLRERYPEAGVYTTAYRKIHPSTGSKKAHFIGIPDKPWEGLLPSYFKSAALGDPPVSASTVGMTREVLNEMGGFETTALFCEDMDLWGRIALKYPIAFSWDGEGIYHTEASGRVCNSKRNSLEEDFSFSTSLKTIGAGEVPQGMYEDLREYVARKEIETAYWNLKAGRPDLARKILADCPTKQLKNLRDTLFFCTYIPSGFFKKLLFIEDFVKSVYSRYGGVKI
jgi:hypothetical protein